jgi:arylsulfatase A-like enzyme
MAVEKKCRTFAWSMQQKRTLFMSKYTRRSFVRSFGLGLAGTPLLTLKAGASIKRPNILFIMADDHASHAISAYGSNLINTPNIDRLAKEGMRFTNCFNVNSLCAPSRAALITGKYSHHNGFMRNGDKFDGSQLTFPKLLQRAGYETALIGKWHLKSQPTGFDYYSVIPGQGEFFGPSFRDSGKPWQESKVVNGYLTDIITDKATKWIDKRDSSKPFCMMVHHKAPHTPHLYPKKYENLYSDADIPMPESFRADYKQRGKALVESQGRWSKLDNIKPNHFKEPIPERLKRGTKAYKEWSYQNFFKGYLRLVAALDDNVGRLLAHLDKSGLAKNTVVIYTSDNGFFLGDFGLFNKMWMYEESLRLPLLVRYPDNIKPEAVNDKLVSILDFAPTILDYAQAKAPKELQGRSFRSVLEGKTPTDWRNAHYYHYYGQYDVPAHYGVRTSNHKLIHYYKQDNWELYDMLNDPQELRNIYNQPEQSKVVEQLKTMLKVMQNKYEDAA